VPALGATKRRNDTKLSGKKELNVSSFPVGSVIFSVRQLSEKKSGDGSAKASLFKCRDSRPRSTFAQVSELFSSSPSRSSSGSAVASKEANEAHESAFNDVQNSRSVSNVNASAPSNRGHGLQDDGDESSGQLPTGVLEAIMMRPRTKAVDQDKRLLKLALDTENRCAFAQQQPSIAHTRSGNGRGLKERHLGSPHCTPHFLVSRSMATIHCQDVTASARSSTVHSGCPRSKKQTRPLLSQHKQVPKCTAQIRLMLHHYVVCG
jgi:hypothetical protein